MSDFESFELVHMIFQIEGIFERRFSENDLRKVQNFRLHCQWAIEDVFWHSGRLRTSAS